MMGDLRWPNRWHWCSLLDLLQPGWASGVPGVVLLVAVGALGLGLLPVLVFGCADRSFMSATTNCAFVSLLALCLVVSILLVIIAPHGFRYVLSCPELAKRSQVNVFWHSSREGVENCSCRTAFPVFQSLCADIVAESYQVFFQYRMWHTKHHSLCQLLGRTESLEVNILSRSQSAHYI